MSIFLNESSKVIVQGMTGSEGRKHTQRMLSSGTDIVGGVTPGKGGQSVDFEGASVAVYSSCAEAVEATGADVSVVFVPPKFTKGADIEAVKKNGRGLPTTEAWANWLVQVTKEQSWIAAVAALRIGTESQSPLLYGRMLPALRNIYRFKEVDIEHFWLHVDADTEHGGRAFDLLERHCTTPELREMAIHYARESAKMRWFYFDGIYLHYEMGYKLR